MLSRKRVHGWFAFSLDSYAARAVGPIKMVWRRDSQTHLLLSFFFFKLKKQREQNADVNTAVNPTFYHYDLGEGILSSISSKKLYCSQTLLIYSILFQFFDCGGLKRITIRF